MKQKNSCQMYKIIKNGKFMGIGTYPKGLVELCSGFEVIEKENNHMTYKEFEEVVEGLGMKKNGRFIMNDYGNAVAYINHNYIGAIDTHFADFKILDEDVRLELFNALVKLSLTPLDKREEVKELTVDEISELLGYKVKIKGEK